MTIPSVFQTNSPEETEAVGAALANQMKQTPTLPPFVALYGDLGVGKTAFIRGFTAELAPHARVKSPTFALVHEYRGEALSVFHFDMYRIDGEDDLYSIGYDDYLDRGICLVEWSENIPYALPDSYLRVTIEKCSADAPDERIISIESVQQ